MVKKAPTNPRWSRGETLIALDFYIATRGSLPPSDKDTRVIQLSEQLRAMAKSTGSDISDTFRNPAGMFMKVRQFQNIDKGSGGLANHSKTDREIFARYAEDPIGRKLAVLAAQSGKDIPDEALPEGLPEDYNAALLGSGAEEILTRAKTPAILGDAIVQPQVRPIGQLLRNEPRLSIPRFQRSYSWGESQVADLCQDIRDLSIQFAVGNHKAQHFFGGLVTVQNFQGLGGIDIVDGQQRITTFVLALHKLSEAYDLLAKRAELAQDTQTQKLATNSAKDIRENYVWITDTHPTTGDPLTRSRLVASQEDEVFFHKYLQGANPVPDRSSQQLLNDASSTVWRELYGPIFAETEPQERQRYLALMTIQAAMLAGSIVVQLAAKDTSAGYRLFMVLNDRGMQLTEGDLLRAETLEKLAEQKDAFKRAAVAWDTVLSHDPEVVKSFLRSFYPSFTGTRAAIRDLVDDYRNGYLHLSQAPLNTQDASNLAGRIERLAEEIQIFALLISDQWPYGDPGQTTAGERQRLSRLLRTLKHELALPLLLSAACNIDQKMFAALVFTLERFAFRYKNVCNGHADAAAKPYYEEAVEIRKGSKKKWPSAQLSKNLKDLILADADEDTFRVRIESQLRYNRTGQRNNIKWLLGALEDCHSWLQEDPAKRPEYPSLDSAVTLNLDAAQIDHIYPQNPEPSDVNPELEPLKEYIGNLTLLEGKHNLIGSNTPFASKRKIYKTVNKVQETKRLSQNKTWSKTKVIERQKFLIDTALILCRF